MTDLAKLSATELVEMYDLRKEEWKRAIQVMADAGRGHETAAHIMAEAEAGGDPLAEQYMLAYNPFFDVSNECQWRLAKHGSLEPIRRRYRIRKRYPVKERS